jgi:hypothetical protein
MRKVFVIAMCFALWMSGVSRGQAQQSGGLKIMELEAEGLCKDETNEEVARQSRQKQVAKLQEMTAMLKRMAAIQKKLSEGISPAEGKEIHAELSRMMEKTYRMLSDLQGMMGGPKKNP